MGGWEGSRACKLRNVQLSNSPHPTPHHPNPHHTTHIRTKTQTPFSFFKKYNSLFEDQITLMIFQCGISAEAFYEHVEERADDPHSADDLAFIATVKATLDFKDCAFWF